MKTAAIILLTILALILLLAAVTVIRATKTKPTPAKSAKIGIVDAIFTRVGASDDLATGQSTFMVEMNEVAEILKNATSSSLIILDEILKGTNSLDKLNGSRMFLEAIAKLPVSGIIATHDLELSKMADEHPDRFHNYCFEIKLSDKITYTYVITPGVAKNQNATYLLKNILT